MSTIAAIAKINSTMTHIMGKMNYIEKQISDQQPVGTTIPSIAVRDDSFLNKEVLDKRFLDVKDGLRTELENSIKQSVFAQLLDKSTSDKVLIDKTIFDLKKEMIQEFKKEIAKEKVLIETTILHQTQGFVSQLVDEKLSTSFSKMKDALKADLIEEMNKSRSEKEQGDPVDADFEIRFGNDEPPATKRRVTKKKPTATATAATTAATFV